MSGSPRGTTYEKVVGRLIEARIDDDFRSLRDADAMIAASRGLLDPVPADERVIIAADWRRCMIMGAETAGRVVDALVRMNPRTLRSGLLGEAARSARPRDASLSEAARSARPRDPPLSEARESARPTDESLGERTPRLGEADDPVSAGDLPVPPTNAVLAEARESLGARDPVASEAERSPGERKSPVGATDDPAPDANESVSEARPVIGDADEAIGEKAKDLAQAAIVEALVAFSVAPPASRHALPTWMATIARRTVADYVTKRTRRSKYEGEMPKAFDDAELDESDSSDSAPDRPKPAVSEPFYDPREDSDEDVAIEGARLFRWLEMTVEGNPRDRETLEMILEHKRTDKAYDQIAAERGITLASLSSRVHEFKKKYTPRYKRERNRAVLLLLLFLGVGVALAVAIYLLFRVPDAPHRPHVAPPRPLIDEMFGGPPPVGAAPPYRYEDDIQPDGGSLAPDE